MSSAAEGSALHQEVTLGPIVLRGATLPVEALDARDDWLGETLADPLVAEALAHGVPALREATASLRRERATARFVARMAGRAVPFGLAATWTVGSLGPLTELTLGGRDTLEVHRRTEHRPDPEADPVLEASPFMHVRGDVVRVLTSGNDGATLSTALSTFVRTALEAVPAPRSRVVRAVARLDVSPERADGFVQRLLDAGLLHERATEGATDLPPSTGRRWTAGRLPQGDEARTTSIDVLRGGSVTLGTELQTEVLRGISLLGRVGGAEAPRLLGQLAAALDRRYGDEAVPLLVALDPELGVGMSGASAPSTLTLPPGTVRTVAEGSPRDHALLGLLQRGREVDLDDRDVSDLTTDDAGLPTSGAAIFTLGSGSTVWWRVLTAPTAGRVLGRAATLSPELLADLRTHVVRADAAQALPVVELVDLPGNRFDAVVRRPSLRADELVLRGAPGPGGGRRLRPRDLRIRVVDGRIVLLDPEGRELLVRHSTAWNPVHNDSHISQLLALLQDAEPTARAWSWGSLRSAPWTPRVRRGRSVLAPETWRIDTRRLTTMDDLRGRLDLPSLVSLGEPGSALVVNLDEPTQADAAFDLLRRGRVRVIQEVPDSPVTSPEGHHVHDLVVGFVHRRPAAPRAAPRSSSTRHTPGSAWLSTTWEATPAGVDRILREHVPALVATTAADQWFFLRFRDPHFHLRLRFKGDARELLPLVHAAHAQAPHLTRLLSIDTYVPETSRYADIDKAEAAFAADSTAVLSLLPSLPPADRWRIALVGAARLLDALCVPALEEWKVRTAVEGSHHCAGKALRAERDLLLAGLDDPDVVAPGASEALGARDERLRSLGIDDLETAVSLAHLHVNRVLVDRHRQHEAVISDLLVRLARVPRVPTEPTG